MNRSEHNLDEALNGKFIFNQINPHINQIVIRHGKHF